MKVLIIGGAGYIGSHVVKEMMKAGHKVTVFDNLSSGLRCNLFPENEFIHGDILIPSEIEAAFAKGFDGFVHLAAFKAAGESMVAPEKYSVNNITGTLNIMNAAVKYNCLRMVFSSSAATFGEPEYLPLDENHPQKPINYYGFTKLKIEEFMKWYDQLKGLKFAALRYFNAAGYDPEGIVRGLEQKPENLLPRVMEAALGQRQLKIFGTDYDTRDGTCIRDYVHVTDLATAHVKALEYIDSKKESILLNLGTEKGTTVKEIIDAARKITGKEIPAEEAPRRPGDPASLYTTSKKAKELLNWEPKYSDVETLVKTTWDVYTK
ncbi:MAG: UDP-glucose 4-epimerase GalE [Treponema sp.]|nr:UDP-glucose 4-epimerase GalE [Spirochaetia bacterium]MDD7014570.1 UDP-glucose 4-epimerase GalE [Spirochaetales bacterium]MDY4901504.1 UDP-glucose 4-epimerase GalE [Treponema sp.]